MLDISAVGSPTSVKAQLEEFVECTGADELITVTYAFDPAVRNRSLELLAELWFLSVRPTSGQRSTLTL